MRLGAFLIVFGCLLAPIGAGATLALSRYDAQRLVGRDGRREHVSGVAAGFVLAAPLLVAPYLFATLTGWPAWAVVVGLYVPAIGFPFAIPATWLAPRLRWRPAAMAIAAASVAIGLFGQYWFETSRTRLHWRCMDLYDYDAEKACHRTIDMTWALPVE